MLGAIIGDIVGSVYEWNNIKTKDFPLFSEKCFFTDDTVMTIAVAEALLNGGTADNFIDSMKKFGRLYPNAGYGGRFGIWVRSDEREPYNSWGNGSAMRVSPCGWFAESLEEAETLAKRSAAVTHNHPEGIKGAQATAAAIYLARTGKPQAEIKSYIESKYKYDLNRTLDSIRPVYKFNASCQETVPEAIIAYLESCDFEDAIRNAISLGGDSDTLAAITGGIAEAAYGIPSIISNNAFYFTDDKLSAVINDWLNAGKPIGAVIDKSVWKLQEI
jgi:ADP-ribosylglycohydrolase